MSELIDHPARELFQNELESSFSVIAPAGVGKTTSIIGRVENLLKKTSRPVTLVTYTQRAAAEMHDRLQIKVGRAASDPERLFVGTIHSFCAQQIKLNPQKYGVGDALAVSRSDYRLWSEFLQEIPLPIEDKKQAEQFLKYFHFDSKWFCLEAAPKEVLQKSTPPPPIDNEFLKSIPTGGKTARAIEKLKIWANAIGEQKATDLWCHRTPPTTESEAAANYYEKIISPYTQWRSQEGLLVAQEIIRKFAQWRLSRGKLTYDDLIEVVAKNIGQPLGVSVILDEAQDTSARQIELLQKAAALEGKRLNFCMVGDPQQSIYGSRVSLAEYWSNHEKLIREKGLMRLTLDVTFRCSQTVVNFVNEHAGVFLNGKEGQADFVPLVPKPNAATGQVAKIILPAPEFEKVPVAKATNLAAAELAKKLKTLASDDLPWHRVAVLAPRREWLEAIAAACATQGIPTQLHSEQLSGSAPLRFLRSLLHLMSYPQDSFELVGLLREITSVDDVVLAQAVKDFPLDFSLSRTEPMEVSGEVAQTLTVLRLAWQRAKALPAPQAILEIVAAAKIEEVLSGTPQAQVNISQWNELLCGLLSGGKVPFVDNISTLPELLKDRPVQEGHLQLLTMHKAKGLEWDVVLLPFLGRAVETKKAAYPRLTTDAEGSLKMYFTADDSLEEAARQKTTQENARLLYVAFTRARTQLILVDDAAFFKTPSRGGAQSFLDIMKVAAAPEEFYKKFPEAEKLMTTQEPPLHRVPAPVEVRVSPPWPVVVPSSLVQHPAELTAEQLLGEGGAAYGNWWHELWPVVGFAETVITQAEKSPHPERATKELNTFISHPLFARLRDAQCRFELPFMARVEDKVIEGRLDLVAIEKDGQILVVDWKTDQIPLETIAASYKAQIEAYRAALQTIYKKPVMATLYSTFHGAWIDEQAKVL